MLNAMSLRLPTSPVYHTSAEHKRQARDAVKKRCGTPKILRDMLREKCRVRMHEARQCQYQKGRKLMDAISENEKQTFNEILRQEVAELEKDLELQEEIIKELNAEWEIFAGHLEEEENYLIEVGETDVLICPVCQKSVLEFTQDENRYSCECGTSGSSTELHTTLESKVDEHGKHCEYNLLFYTEPNQIVKAACTNANDGYVLNAMCDNCDFFVNF